MNELIAPDELREQQRSGRVPTVIDVRGPDEYAAGHLPGALHIPAEELASRLEEIPPDRPVVTY